MLYGRNRTRDPGGNAWRKSPEKRRDASINDGLNPNLKRGDAKAQGRVRVFKVLYGT